VSPWRSHRGNSLQAHREQAEQGDDDEASDGHGAPGGRDRLGDRLLRFAARRERAGASRRAPRSRRRGFPDAGNDPAETMTRQAYDLVAAGFGPGASGPLMLTAQLPSGRGEDPERALTLLRERVAAQPEVLSAAPAQLNRGRDAAVLMVTPRSSPQDEATRHLVGNLRDGVLPQIERSTGMTVNVGGMTAAITDQAEFTLARLPLFIGAVVSLSFLLLLAAFRSLPVAVKAGVLNLLSIGAAYGVVALVADGGWAGQLVGIDTPTPVPPFIPVSCSRSSSGSRWTTRCSCCRASARSTCDTATTPAPCPTGWRTRGA